VSETELSGWGRTTKSRATLRTPESEADLLREFASGERLIARGLGRSYGDAAQLGGGVVLDSRQLAGIGTIDADGTVTVGAGVSVDALLAVSIPLGWFIPVTPGTRQVTMGGAVAADVHGKNHHVDGSFASHVLSMRLVTPVGAFTLSPSLEPELFWATMGAMGLTGIVTSITLQMLPIETNQMLVDTERFDDLASVMEAMVIGDVGYRYSVAWVDCMARGARQGRAVLTRANHAQRVEVEHASLKAPRARSLSIPFVAPRGLLNRWSVKVFDEFWYRSASQYEVGEAQSLATFFHPLDGVSNWNRLYGPRGFVQYQFCVPDEAGECVVAVIERLSESRLASFLAVLKRFGPGNPAPLSFPLAGWTLALDLPVGSPKLPGVLDELDEMVTTAGGRVYFAKDARLNANRVGTMYPRLDQFLKVKSLVDPKGQLTSDLAQRLGLVGT
jgi:decaprenylphospho-beta-D-ribofuranose 2-oxidase